MHYLLIYDLAPDYMERRGEFRNQHLSLAWDAHARGEMVLGGALSEPVDQAILLFQGETSVCVEQFVAADPYVAHGLVTRWQIRPWITVIGDLATIPIRL